MEGEWKMRMEWEWGRHMTHACHAPFCLCTLWPLFYHLPACHTHTTSFFLHLSSINYLFHYLQRKLVTFSASLSLLTPCCWSGCFMCRGDGWSIFFLFCICYSSSVYVIMPMVIGTHLCFSHALYDGGCLMWWREVAGRHDRRDILSTAHRLPILLCLPNLFQIFCLAFPFNTYSLSPSYLGEGQCGVTCHWKAFAL